MPTSAARASPPRTGTSFGQLSPPLYSPKLLLDFFLEEIGPAAYNGAIGDAQAVRLERVTELDSACYRDEFTYWRPRS